jgi:outer membrane protein assembly factor BamE
MSHLFIFRLRFIPLALAGLALGACSSFDAATTKAVGIITPYKMDIVQGNVVTKEQFAMVKPGMSRNQVRDVMGTALLVSVFHADRWDYVFSMKSQSAKNQQTKVVVFFKDDVVERTEGDQLPTEFEFVSTLKSWAPAGSSKPALEASEETLKKFPPPSKPAATAQAPAPASAAYPPLEPSAK